MIDATFLVDITDLIKTELNYLEKIYTFSTESNRYEIKIRTIVDRAYNISMNSHQDYYRYIFFVFKNRTFRVFLQQEFQLLALSVGGKNNLKLNEFVGVIYNESNDRDQIIFFHYAS